MPEHTSPSTAYRLPGQLLVIAIGLMFAAMLLFIAGEFVLPLRWLVVIPGVLWLPCLLLSIVTAVLGPPRRKAAHNRTGEP